MASGELSGKRVTVVGAGFSGLSAAYYLQKAGFQVEVLEERRRPGGLISTLREPFGLVETAANGLINSGYVEELFDELGLPLTPTLRTARRRYIFRDGRPRQWPLGLAGTFGLFSFFAKFFLARKGLSPRPFESAREWATRVFGEEFARYLVEGALQGIYAGDAGRMSASLIFGRFFEAPKVKRRKPRVRGTVSAPQGMGQLIETWRKHLESKGVEFHFEAKMDVLLEAPRHPVVLATSAQAAARILEKVDAERAEVLRKVELLPLMSVTMSFDAPSAIRGFGCLFPPVEKRWALGVLMNDCIFPDRGAQGFSETWILGGAHEKAAEILQKSDDEILALIQSERKVALGAPDSRILGYRVTRWPQAIPHYTTELERILPQIRGMRGNVVLIGNYLGQIGLAKILESAAELPGLIQARGQWI